MDDILMIMTYADGIYEGGTQPQRRHVTPDDGNVKYTKCMGTHPAAVSLSRKRGKQYPK